MLSDDEFLHAFFSTELPNSDFHHRDHLRLTWLVVGRRGLPEAERVIAEAIQHFAAVHGHAARYHHTMTRVWVRLEAHAGAKRAEIQACEAFLPAYPTPPGPTLPFP